MNEMRRVLALLLCAVMLVGILPVGALAAETETTAPSETVAEAKATEAAAAAVETTGTAAIETTAATTVATEDPYGIELIDEDPVNDEDEIDYLFVATDRHANTSVIGNIINNMESTIGGNELDYLALGGDMVGSGDDHPTYSSSTVLAEVTGATSSLDETNVDIVAGIHDMNVNDDAGIVLPYTKGGAQIYEGDNFYVYGVEEYCISEDSNESNWSAQAQKFVTWAESVKDTSKAIIVVSHYPLHVKRNDNPGAVYWHDALNDVATDDEGNVVRNVVFFHGHNHTVDKNEYVYGVGDSMDVEGAGSSEIFYTYATAGYLNQNSKATLVTITDSTIYLEKYTTSGEGTEMATIARVVEETPVETTTPTESEPAEEEKTVSYMTISEGSGVAYVVGDTAVLYKMYVSYTDGTSGYATQDDCTLTIYDESGNVVTEADALATPGTYSADVTYLGYTCGTKLSFTVSASGDSSYDLLNLVINGATVNADVQNVTEDEKIVSAMGTVEGVSSYVAYDIDADLAEGETATLSIPIPEGWDTENLTAYYITDEGEVSDETFEGTYADGYYTFTVTHFSIYVVTDKTEDADKDLTLGGTTEVTKTVYVLTSSISSGNEYLIVNGNSAGSYYALANNSGSVAATGVTVKTDSTIGTYIELDDATDELWTTSAAIGSSTSSTLKNGSYYLYASSDGIDLSTSTGNNTSWRYTSNNQLYRYRSGRTSYYLYNSGGTWAVSSSSSSPASYFYVPTEVTVTESNEVNYKVVASDITHVYDTDSTTAETEALTYELQANGETATFDGEVWSVAVVSDPDGIIDTTNSTNETLYFTGATGEATVRIYYQLDANGDGDVTDADDYKVWTTINVSASEPFYTIDIEDVTGVSVTDTIVIKGEDEMNDGLYLNYNVTYTDDEDTVDFEVTDPTKITWTSSNTGIANFATDENGEEYITFPGGEGSVQITVYYEYADGKQVMDYVNISVSKSSHTIPADGTDDFPDYPNQGAIRIDKTAEAVGNFSETGMAKVELSMTGVPFTTGNELDVVVMLDMSTSMDDDRIAATVAATKTFVASIVKNEDGSYNSNRIYVGYFNGDTVYTITGTDNIGGELASVDNDTEYNALIAAIEDEYDGALTASGTNYDVSLEECYNVLTEAKSTNLPPEAETAEDYSRQQFCVFMSDGGPTDYATSASTVVAEGTVVDWFTMTDSDSANWTNTVPEEYWSGLMKDNDVTIYTVGLILQEAPTSGPQDYRGYTADENYYVTSTLLTGIASGADYFINCESADDTAEMEGIFDNIAHKILEAATNVQVVDKVGSNYTMTFKLPNNVSADDTGMDEFYIQVVEYTLDETTKERVDANNDGVQDHTVKEKFLFNADGTLNSHTSAKGTSCTGTACTHVTFTDGVVTAINGDYFTYSSTDEGEFLTWDEEKISTTELALQYFAYLDNSAGFDVADQVDPGSYYTNDYAYVTYTNFNGTECRLDFPQPQMTWSGAQVTYVFYLVNENGEPVNRAGRVIPFANRVEVTDPVTKSITWYSNDDKADILAEDLFAIANVPEVYQLYDENAEYVVRVYETEGVDTNAVNYNYFTIGGSDQTTLNAAHTDRTATNASLNTTKVYTTLAGSRYDTYGVYSKQAVNTVLDTTDKDGNPTTVTVTKQVTDIDYANTTVAFAVVWKPELQPDTVVIDYGLDVVINVATNDALASGIVGVRADAPAGITMNSGTYEAAKATSADIYLSDNTTKIATATTEPGSIQSVRFSLDKTNGMQFTEPASFYYESDCNYYKNGVLQTTSMYSQVTVIPATTVYYEDEYVTTLEYHSGSTLLNGITDGGWGREGSTITATQAVDRPGVQNGMSPSYDANNEYGYDEAYDSSTTLSMGSALKVNVSGTDYAIAEFDFYGTGFDIVSMTDSTTGTITVKVLDENGEVEKRLMVDNYYGYAYGICKVTKVWDGYNEFIVKKEAITEAEKESLPTSRPAEVERNVEYAVQEETWYPSTAENGIYQVPVIKASGLDWGKHTVRINVAYSELFDHADKGSSNFYLDAIRIYDPIETDKAVDTDTTVSDIYAVDGEGWPQYKMVRDMLAKSGFDATSTEDVEGIVFIDGKNTSDIAEYANYGPNNEVYLTNGQAIAFELTNVANAADVQLGLKCATEGNTIATLSIYDGTTWDHSPGNIENTNSATDRYYSIGEYLEGKTDPIVVIKNTGSGILSITNVKTTYSSAPTQATSVEYRMSVAGANAVLMMLNAEPEVEETPVVLPDAELEVSVNGKNLKVGNTVTVKVTTSDEVESLTVNGQEVTEYKQNKKTGKRTWTVKVTAEEAGDMDIAVTAYSAEGYELDTVTETVTVAQKNNGKVNKVVGQLLDKLFG